MLNGELGRLTEGYVICYIGVKEGRMRGRGHLWGIFSRALVNGFRKMGEI